jgi:hypothetical protein
MNQGKVRDVLERVVKTAFQAFVGALPMTVTLTTDGLAAAGWAGAIAAFAATVSLIKNLVTSGAATASGNIFERFAWTATAAFIGSVPVQLHLVIEDAESIARAAATAAIAAIISLAQNLQAEGTVIEATRRAAGAGAHVPDLGGQ